MTFKEGRVRRYREAKRKHKEADIQELECQEKSHELNQVLQCKDKEGNIIRKEN